MFSKVLNSACQGSDKCLPIPAIFHDMPLKGSCSYNHWYICLLHFFIKCFTEEPVAEAFVSLLPAEIWWEAWYEIWTRLYKQQQKFQQSCNVVEIHSTVRRSHEKNSNSKSASNVAASPCGCPPVLTVVSFSLRGCLTTTAFASTSTSTFIWSSSLPLLNWNGASVFTWITENTMMDCLYLLLHQLAGGERCQLY